MRTREVTKGITLWPTDRPDYPFAAVLTYSPADPYAVRLAFIQCSRETVVHRFARNLLAEGMDDAAGQCDVTVSPHEEVDDYLVLTVRGAVGYPFAVYAFREPVQDFLDQAFGLVPMGREREHLNLDAALDAFFGEVTS
ncbi:SsgA family sporulation/cell division regulator [Streptosporangium canum]|uniref:SsgA family sporulation/cell division regulator n=1 Tax=Streptosporangium canum TaxID=324952 RepID=UPI00343420D1